MVGLGRDQKPVDKAKRCGRRHQRDHQQRLVEIGPHNVDVLGFVHRAAHDVVAARRYLGDHGRALGLLLRELHVVAHRQRVADFQAFDFELAPQPAAVQLPGGGSRTMYHEPVDLTTVPVRIVLSSRV